MSVSFWVKRIIIAFLGSGAVLFAIELAKGHQHTAALQFAALWGLAFAVLFTLIGYIRFKRDPACMLPRERQKQV